LAGKKFVDAAIVQDNAVQKLNASLKINGMFTEQTSKQLQDFASTLQANSTIGDEASINMLAYAVSLGATEKQAKKIVTAAAEMSAAMDTVSFETATEQLARSLSGSAGRLAMYGINLKGVTKEQLQAGHAAELVAKQFEGFAKAKTLTFAGAMEQLSNTVGDLFERFGDTIVQSPIMIKAFNGIAKGVKFLTEQFDPKPFTKFVEFIIIGAAQIADTFSFLIYPFEALYKGALFAFNAIRTGAVTMAAGVLTAVAEMVDMLPNFAKKFIDVEGLQQAKDGAVQMMTDLGMETRESFDNMFQDYSFSDKIVGGLEEFAESLRTVQEGNTETINKIKEDTATGATEVKGWYSGLIKTQKDFAKQSKVALLQGAVSTFSNAFQAMGAAVANGTDVMKAAFGALLAGFGQTLVQLGAGYMLQGGAMLFAGQPGGPALIAQGAAMSVLGGFISAKFGGAAGGAPSAGGAAGGAAAGGDSTTDPLTGATPVNILEDEEPEAIEKQQQVQLVVQGDVLDSEETGTRLLNILNEEFDSKGGRIAYA
jgi:hypothetical protein